MNKQMIKEKLGPGRKLPIKGLSDVIGIISDTVLRKIVRERRIVTPENHISVTAFPSLLIS
jgi:hypothetical protein